MLYTCHFPEGASQSRTAVCYTFLGAVLSICRGGKEQREVEGGTPLLNIENQLENAGEQKTQVEEQQIFFGELWMCGAECTDTPGDRLPLANLLQHYLHPPCCRQLVFPPVRILDPRSSIGYTYCGETVTHKRSRSSTRYRAATTERCVFIKKRRGFGVRVCICGREEVGGVWVKAGA